MIESVEGIDPAASRVPGESDLSLRNVAKSFDGVPVIRDLSFSVERGSIFGLIGPSGSGKTTAILMALGVVRPDSGEISVLGRDPRRFDTKTREQLGYMPQHFVLYPELTVRENLDFVASCNGVPMRGRGRRIDDLLEFVELHDARHTLSGSISGGMKRRLELASTLIHEPQLIVVDEPTAGIDPVLRQKFWTHFRSLRDAGRTIFVTTQYVTEAEYCDVVAALRDGVLAALGPPDQVRRQAMGAEIIDVVADGLTWEHIVALQSLDGVSEVNRSAVDRLRISVANAGEMMPVVIQALQAANVPVGNISQYKPNFDEVFVRLMEVPASSSSDEADKDGCANGSYR